MFGPALLPFGSRCKARGTPCRGSPHLLGPLEQPLPAITHRSSTHSTTAPHASHRTPNWEPPKLRGRCLTGCPTLHSGSRRMRPPQGSLLMNTHQRGRSFPQWVTRCGKADHRMSHGWEGHLNTSTPKPCSQRAPAARLNYQPQDLRALSHYHQMEDKRPRSLVYKLFINSKGPETHFFLDTPTVRPLRPVVLVC